MDVYSWIFIAVFGVALAAAVTSAVCKRVYEKRMIKFFSKASNYTTEERETIKKILKDNSEDLGINIFDLMEDN